MPTIAQRMIHRQHLHTSLTSTAACHSCALLWLSVQAFHDWNKVVRVLLDFTVVPSTLTIWPFNIDNAGPDGSIGQVDKVVLYNHEGQSSKWPGVIGVAAGSTIPCDEEEMFCKAKRWIDECKRQHGKCRGVSSGYLPTRLIDVGDEATDPKLVITHDMPGIRDYLAFSHCWGAPGSISKKLELTRQTMGRFQSGIPLSDFPQTFYDAILTTRKLGYKYIWVDSLCILQRDALDWANEASQMCSVYQNADLTIAADRASSSDDGFLGKAVDLSSYVHFMQFTNATGEKDVIYARNIHYTPPSLASLGCYAGEQKSFLDSRAWTFQERMLSPRVLHFGEFEVMWECDECERCACEMKPAESLFKKEFVDFLQNDGSDVIQHAKLWTQMVTRFSARNITFDTDRLPAIGGLAAAVQQGSEDDYLAGHWKASLERTLLWQTGTGAQHENYYAPSWSWASVTRPASFVGQKARLLWSVVEARCTLAGPNKYGPVTDGYVCVQGPVAEVYVHREIFFSKVVNKERVRYVVFSEDHPTIKKLLDRWTPDFAPEDWEKNVTDGSFRFLFAAVEGSPGGWGMGLLLKKAPSEADVFERVGLVVCDRQQWKNWEAVTEVQTVKII